MSIIIKHQCALWKYLFNIDIIFPVPSLRTPCQQDSNYFYHAFANFLPK